ncbi:MAG: DUF2786 domain-containing protein [Actinomycetales bacterium]|nr:DUF2786 domain-containing protein [Actinomycetales bacterium]
MSLERISALLAKAERTDNPHEAEAYLMKAQALATAASIDLAVARAAVARREARQQPQTRTVTIGEKGKRANQHLIALFIAIAHANDARVDIAANSTYVLAYGMPGDLDVIEAMYGSVAVQMVTAATTWVAVGTWRQESYVSVQRVQGRARRTVKPHTAFTARVAFYRGYVERIAERLEQARASVITASPGDLQAAGSEGGTPGSAAAGLDPAGRTLVLKQKADEIREYHRATSKARGSWSGYSGAMRSDRGSATGAGRQAASLARLGSQRGLPGKKPVRGSST